MKKRILVVHQYYAFEGFWGNDRSKCLAEYWAKQGWEVTVLTTVAYVPKHHPAWQSWYWKGIQNQVKIHCFRIPYHQKFSFLKRLWYFLIFAFIVLFFPVRSYSVVYVISPPLPAAWIFLLKRPKRLFLEMMDAWPDVPIEMGILKNRFLQRIAIQLTSWLYKKSDKLLPLSPGVCKLLKRRYKVPSHKILCTYNGTNTRCFVPKKKPLPPPLKVLYAGAIGLVNDVMQLVKALQLVNEQYPGKVRCDIYGWGSHKTSLKAYITKYRLTFIRVLDPLPKKQLAKRMGDYHIGVVTVGNYKILEHNSANKFYDYLSAGLPVVINYGGWQAAFLRRFHCGLSCRNNDVENFAHCIQTFLLHPQLLKRYSKNARKAALHYFDRSQIAQKIIDEGFQAVWGK